MKNYQELVVWRKAHQMTLDVYGATRGFPKEELYGLTSQLRRAAAQLERTLRKDRDGDQTTRSAAFCR